jgi:hypothetical protein
MSNIRIGNIELRTVNAQQEIVAWYPNIYYGKEKDYKFNPATGMYDASEYHHIHPSCFKHKESCYVIAFVNWNGAHDEFNLRTVGLRPWELEEKDTKDFLEILKHIKLEDEE